MKNQAWMVVLLRDVGIGCSVPVAVGLCLVGVDRLWRPHPPTPMWMMTCLVALLAVWAWGWLTFFVWRHRKRWRWGTFLAGLVVLYLMANFYTSLTLRQLGATQLVSSTLDRWWFPCVAVGYVVWAVARGRAQGPVDSPPSGRSTEKQGVAKLPGGTTGTT